MKHAIGIDMGGTRIKGVVMNSDKKVLEQLVLPTNDNGKDDIWKQFVAEAVNKLSQGYPMTDTVIGISAPGVANENNSAIACMPGRLQGLENLVWSDFLGRKSWVLNDALSALLAEANLGVARNRKQAVLLTLGTGVGGAVLIDGRPYQGYLNKAGSIGHMVVDSSEDPDATGMPGSLENAIGNCTIYKRSRGRFSSTQELLESYAQNDPFSRWVWLSSVRKLAIGIASIINILSPECVILAGGITEAGDDLFGPLNDFMQIYEWRPSGYKTEIIKAAFGDMAGAIGAACFALEQSNTQVS